MRRVIAVPCDGETLAATLDEADGPTGLLIVSGGNEIRCGAHRGMAMLAEKLAARGVTVLRYDRRGIGDSSGINHGFLSAQPDLVAAAAALRTAAPHLTRIVGFGNCDAASTLALYGEAVGLDAVILANPWVVEDNDDLPPAAAIRARYAERLRDPRAWLRLLRGGVNIRSLFRGLRKLTKRPTQAAPFETQVLDAITHWGSSATVILAEADSTARAYAEAARRKRATVRTIIIHTASHSFAGAENAARLEAEILGLL